MHSQRLKEKLIFAMCSHNVVVTLFSWCCIALFKLIPIFNILIKINVSKHNHIFSIAAGFKGSKTLPVASMLGSSLTPTVAQMAIVTSNLKVLYHYHGDYALITYTLR